jgi:hypothetical protein
MGDTVGNSCVHAGRLRGIGSYEDGEKIRIGVWVVVLWLIQLKRVYIAAIDPFHQKSNGFGFTFADERLIDAVVIQHFILAFRLFVLKVRVRVCVNLVGGTDRNPEVVKEERLLIG